METTSKREYLRASVMRISRMRLRRSKRRASMALIRGMERVVRRRV
jgi:hypothetical protein